MESSNLWTEFIPGGGTWSHVLKRGTSLRLTDREGGANVGAYFLNAALPVERYNMADTLKAQHTAMLTSGHVLMSDMGRILCSITEDTAGWHDPISGCSNAASVEKKYGKRDYQEARNEWHRNAGDGFLIELQKYGLGARDLQAIVNFFAKVTVDANGGLHYHAGFSKPGSTVTLRAEMDSLVVLNTCQHPLDPSSHYSPKPIEVSILRTPAPTSEDLCFTRCPENQRAHLLTERYHL